MALASALIPSNTRLRFMAFARPAMLLSLVLILGTLGWVGTRGLNLGIDFAGGILLEIRTQQPADLATLRPLFTDPAYGDTSLQHFGDSREVLIRMEGNAHTEQAATVEQAKASLMEALGDEVEFRRVDYVGPTVGAEMLESGALALLIAFAGMLLYIWMRFEWQFGVGALVALVHDSILTIGFYAFFDMEFGLSAVAAVLTVIGYSINDSVVIFDRIRENLRKYGKASVDEVIDISLNETLSRTILTGATTVMAAGVLAIFGGEIIRSFSLALCVGVVVGTYSSVYIAAPALKYFHVSREIFDKPASG